MTGIENQQLRGYTIKNLIATIVSTAGICVTLMGVYNGVMNRFDKTDQKLTMSDSARVRDQRINDLRLRNLENRQNMIDQQINALQNNYR